MTKDLTVGKPDKVLWKFCLPLFGSIIFQQLYNIADSFVAGKFVGEDALAAVGNSYEITLIFIAFAFGCNIGCSVIVSRLFGAKRLKDMKTAVYTTLISGGVLCLALMIGGLVFSDGLLRLIHTPDNILSDSKLYLDIYIWGLPFVFFYNVATGIFSALGDSKTPFIFLAASSVSNIGADILFVTAFHMGVSGVAWATFICQGISCILAMVVVFRKFAKIETEGKAKPFSWRLLVKIAAVAVPSILQQSFISVGNIIIQGIINDFGSSVIAGYAASVKLNNLVITSLTTLGKTETYRALRDYFRDAIPGFMVTIYDVSGLTAAGFKGQEPSDVLLPYFRAKMTDAFGICFLDELDKKIAPAYSSTGENINAEVQGQLLTMIEGGDVYDKRGMKINTERMMFIGLGSFSSFRQTREQTPRRVGILAGNEREEEAERNDHFAPLTAEDMVEAGGSWELLGRFSSIINYRKLDRTAIRRIIEKTMQHEADIMGIDLDIEEEAVDELTEIVEDSKFGCRFIYSRLHSIIMRTYSNALLEIPEDNQMTILIRTLDDVSYKFTEFTPEDKQDEAELMAKLKAKEEALKEEAVKTSDDDGWLADLMGLWE